MKMVFKTAYAHSCIKIVYAIIMLSLTDFWDLNLPF